jgi:hypothetical protein
MNTGNWFDRQPSYVRLFLGILIVTAALLILALAFVLQEAPEWVPNDAPTEDTLIPPSADADRLHYTPRTLSERDPAALLPAEPPAPYSLRWRAGVSVPDRLPLYYEWPAARPGWYLNWEVNVRQREQLFGLWRQPYMRLPDARLAMEFTPMVRMRSGRLYPPTGVLRELAAQNPGLTWLIGNEPDVRWQDNTTPEMYAIAYHRAYTAIKAGDPTAQVAVAGLSQITPLRLTYLTRMWDFYQKLYGVAMPVDVWNMHAFVLREERVAWGVNIPPGFEIEPRGRLWEVEDHDNLSLIEEQIRAMRGWMVERGQQDKPLWITEYGILMPEEYGFDAERVISFMLGSFELFLNLRDDQLGYPADDHRLVQRWNWYPTRDSRYSAGNLFDNYGRVTPVGQALFDFLADGLPPLTP